MKRLFFPMLAIMLMLTPCTVLATTNTTTSSAKSGILATPALNLVSETYNSVTFTISKVEGATGYHIERSTNANFTTYETITTTALTYTDKSLVTGTTYYYRIEAYNNNAKSGKSSSISTKLELDRPEIELSNYSHNALKLNITAVKGASYYKVEVRKGSSGYGDIIRTFNTTKTSNIIDNLEYNSSYNVTVTAYTKTASGDVASDYVRYSKTVILPSVNVNTRVTNNNEITISYNAIPGVSTYAIYRKDNNNNTYTQIVRTTGTSYVDKNLAIEKYYNYKVEAIVTEDNETHTSTSYASDGLYPLKSLAKPSFTIKKVKNGYYSNSIQFDVKKVAYADEYVLYEMNSKKQYEVIGRFYNETLTKILNYIEYGTHKYAIRAYNYDTKIYSAYSELTFNYTPEKPSVSIKKVKYNQNTITIKAPKDNQGNDLSYDTTYKFEVYRSTDDKKYNLIKTITGKDVYNDTVFTDKIKDAIPGTTYYYRVKLVINNSKSVYSKTVKMKSVIPKPTIKVKSEAGKRTITVDNVGSGVKYVYYEATKKDGKYKKICESTKTTCSKTIDWTKTHYYKVTITVNGKKYAESKIITSKSNAKAPTINVYNSANDKQIIKFDSLGKDVHYEVYQATSKNGKYKKVCDTTKTSCSVNVSWNKTYYYKVKAYITVDKKKKYTKFSKVIARKVSMVGIVKYPITLTTNYGESKSIIKSVTFTKKSSGNNTKYNMKINYKSKYSNANRKVYSTVYFYNYDLSKKYTYTLTEKVYRGTRKNTSTTFNIKLPKWAMFYYFK